MSAALLSTHLAYVDQQPGVERVLVGTQPELGVVVGRDGELEVTWRRREGRWMTHFVNRQEVASSVHGPLRCEIKPSDMQ